MTYLCSIFFIFVTSVDPLSKNKSRIIIQKCRNLCKQLTLPGRTVQQLPFFKTVRLYTVIKICYQKISELCSNFNYMSDKSKFYYLFTNEDLSIINIFGKCIIECLETRKLKQGL